MSKLRPSAGSRRSSFRGGGIETLIFDQKSQAYRNINITEEQWQRAVKGDSRMRKYICVKFRKAAGCSYVDFDKLELAKPQAAANA